MDCLGSNPLHINRRTCLECKRIYSRKYRAKDSFSAKQYWLKIKDTPMELAKREVYKAVRSGIIPMANTLFCEDCKNPAQCYDHRDYLRPLDVEPVCYSCNKLRGQGLNRGF